MMMTWFINRASVALLLLVAAGGVHSAQAQNYDGDGVVRVGLFAQGTWLDIEETTNVPSIASGSLDGFAGGISAGYDFWRTPHWVLGFEGDVALGDMQDTPCCTEYGLDYMSTFRGRAGFYMHPNWLVYATGGVAWLGLEAQDTVTRDKVATTLTGWTVGGGTEVDWGHMILFAEYLYTDFGSDRFSLDTTLGPVTHRTEFDGHHMRLGVKFKVGHDYFHHGYGHGAGPLK